MSVTKKIIITDDHPLLIDGLVALIGEHKQFTVCATATNGKQLIQIIPVYQPDLIVLDINLPEIDGIEAAKIIKRTNPDIKILFISTYFDDALIETFKAIPVDGFIPKQTDSKTVIKVIGRVLEGEAVFMRSNIENNYPKAGIKELELLSAREKEVLHLIKKGKSTKEIAAALFLSVYTIDTHRKNICGKLNLESPGALIRFAMEKDF